MGTETQKEKTVRKGDSIKVMAEAVECLEVTME